MAELSENLLRLSKIDFSETVIEQVDLSQIANEIIIALVETY